MDDTHIYTYSVPKYRKQQLVINNICVFQETTDTRRLHKQALNNNGGCLSHLGLIHLGYNDVNNQFND